MPLQTLTAQIGVAKQSARGTIAANPTYAHGLSSGAPVMSEATQNPLEVTTGKRAASTMIREIVKSGGGGTFPAYIRTLGLYLLGAIGTDTVTGAGPYLHTYTTGDLPYLSVFAKGIGSEIAAVKDCKLDELSLKWEGAKPLELSISAMGTNFSYPSTFTVGTDDTGSDAFLVPVGGTFEVDVVGSTPATARVISGELTIKNNVSSVDASGSIEPVDQIEGLQEHEVKLTIVPDDMAAFREALTGASNGTAVASTVPYGAVNLVFKENGGNGTLTVSGTKVAFSVAFPEASPSGETTKLELAGIAVLPAGGSSPLTYALSNGVATY
jgi:hypothetical protein